MVSLQRLHSVSGLFIKRATANFKGATMHSQGAHRGQQPTSREQPHAAKGHTEGNRQLQGSNHSQGAHRGQPPTSREQPQPRGTQRATANFKGATTAKGHTEGNRQLQGSNHSQGAHRGQPPTSREQPQPRGTQRAANCRGECCIKIYTA